MNGAQLQALDLPLFCWFFKAVQQNHCILQPVNEHMVKQ